MSLSFNPSAQRAGTTIIMKPTISAALRGLVLLLLIITLLPSCKKDEPGASGPPANEEELITTVRLHFHSVGGAEHKHWTYRDIDGPGGNDPVVEVDSLSSDSVYHVEIDVLDESASPADTITAEIEDEGADHQFFFQPSGVNIAVAYDDADVNGRPIGLRSIWTVGASGSGTMLITLRHEPDKTAPGVTNGDISNAGGETDIAVDFTPVVVD